MVEIRGYRGADLDALYDIALQTGASGTDATGLYRDPRLVGHVYAAPYASLEPESAFVVEDEAGVGGYIVGCKDTRAFEARLEAEWWPTLKPTYGDPHPTPHEGWDHDQRLSYLIYHPPHAPTRVVEEFPAHLHINLLPRLQGQGLGGALIDRWLNAMRRAGAYGAHLGVGVANQRAIGFYRHHGLTELRPSGVPPQVLWFAKRLAP
ncbi:MAG TPA: GNAT family N-acetyltransferase [Caulobacteraceae bacterium]